MSPPSTADKNLLETPEGRDLLAGLCRVMKLKLDRAQNPPRVLMDVADPKDAEKTIQKIMPNPEYVDLGAAEMSAILSLLRDNSVTLANIERGDFGESVKRANDQFPFQVVDGGKA